MAKTTGSMRDYMRDPNHKYPATTRSLVDVVFKDGGTEQFIISASPAVMQTLLNNAADTGFFMLFNESDTLCIATDEVRTLSARSMNE